MKNLWSRAKQYWKYGDKSSLLPIFVVASLVSLIVFIILTGGPKTPVTAEQMFQIMETEGYEPTDALEKYRRRGLDRTDLINVVEISTEEFTFTFFEFLNDDGSQALYRLYASVIQEEVYKISGIEYGEASANYTIYSVKTDEHYAINFRVGNTEIYAVGSRESAADIRALLVQMGYYNE